MTGDRRREERGGEDGGRCAQMEGKNEEGCVKRAVWGA